jgi:glycosyltransferase involved in cell wall biosynthesis
MNRSDLLVLPSIAEGFGIVLLEALSCGTPILCSDATAGPDLLKGWDEQFIFSAGDWNGLASRLDHWLTNVGCLRKMRSSARNLAESQTWERFRSSLRDACNSDVKSEHLS